MFADRRAMRTPTPHVTPSVCSAIFSMNHRTVDFRPWWRPRSMLKFRAGLGTHQRLDTKTKNCTHMQNVFADRRARRTPTPHGMPGVCGAILSTNHARSIFDRGGDRVNAQTLSSPGLA